jgi:hypothetical protein
VQEEVALGLMRILVEVVDTLGIERRGAAFQTMDFVTFGKQEFRQVGTILSGNSGDQRTFRQRPTS